MSGEPATRSAPLARRGAASARPAAAPAPLGAGFPQRAVLRRGEQALRRADPRLAALIGRVGPARLQCTGDPYRALVRAVLRQQLAGVAAAAIERRLRGHFAGRIPRAERLAQTSDEVLRGLGLSRQKAAALRAIAEAFASGRLASARLRQLPDAEVVAQVTQLRGIGEWTAQMLLIFSLGRLDVLPVGDYGVRRGAQTLYGLLAPPGRVELEALAAPWRPYRSLAAWYLWRASELPAAP